MRDSPPFGDRSCPYVAIGMLRSSIRTPLRHCHPSAASSAGLGGRLRTAGRRGPGGEADQDCKPNMRTEDACDLRHWHLAPARLGAALRQPAVPASPCVAAWLSRRKRQRGHTGWSRCQCLEPRCMELISKRSRQRRQLRRSRRMSSGEIRSCKSPAFLTSPRFGAAIKWYV